MLKLKSSFAVVLVWLVFKCIIKENVAGGTGNNEESSRSSPGYEPFMAVAPVFGIPPILPGPSSISPPDFQLPSKFIKVGNEWKLGSESLRYMFEIPLCPEMKSNEENIRTFLNMLNEYYPKTRRCLFQRPFRDDENQVCDREPEPSLDTVRDENRRVVVCGVHADQQLVGAQYYNCGTYKNVAQYGQKVQAVLESNIEDKAIFEMKFFRIYEICYDFIQEKTLWTRHTPMTPALLSHPESPYKNLSNSFQLGDFSTEIFSLDLPPSTFSDLKQQYETNDSNTNVMSTLVPKNHMALRYWKKATSHMINTAPLLPELVPLLKAINDGIYLASVNLFEKSQKKLHIYTCTRDGTEPSIVQRIVSSTPLVNSVVARHESKILINISEPNIWYQFVHDESDEAGVLIVLHNTRGELPQQKECKKTELLDCDFKSWSSYPESIHDDIPKHAYCCEVSEKRVKNLFSIKELKLNKSFDIQEQINAARAGTQKNDDNEK